MITSSRTIQIQLSGDVTLSMIESALDNVNSIGQLVSQTLIAGNNTIAAPIVSGLTISALTIIPPSDNTILMTMAGIPLHLTDPTSIALDTTFVNLIINVVSTVIGVRFIWS